MLDSHLGIPLGLVLLHGSDAHIALQETGPTYLRSSHPSDSVLVHAVNILVDHNRIYIKPEGEPSTPATHPLQVAIWAVPQDAWTFAIVPKNVQTAYFQLLAHIRVPPWTDPQPQQQRIQYPPQEYCTNGLSTNKDHVQLLQDEADTRLLDIYLQLPSPSVDSSIVSDDHPTGIFGETTNQLLDACIEMDSPEGMKTKLYGYQKRSLYKMVQRELIPRKMHDPTFVPLRDGNNQPYILNTNQAAFGIYRKPPFEWDDVRGGILCEDMGTGKTCICIALILHTRHQISLPPITSPPTLVHCDILPLVQSSIVDLECDNQPRVIPTNVGVPSLVDIAVAAIKVHGIQYSEDIVGPYLFDKLDKFPAYTLERPHRETQSHASQLSPGTRKNSRRREDTGNVARHTHEHALEVLVIPETSSKPIPPAETLIKQDIVLISQSRFSREYDSGAFVKILSSKRKCTCDSIITLARCRCPVEQTTSPLQHVRWKRMIVDEGHSMGSQSSNYALLASALHVERRWICTGTPTQNLSNLADYYQPTDYHNDTDVSTTQSGGTSTKRSALSARHLAASDQDDLVKLSTIITSYLRLEPFASKPKLFSKELQVPFSSSRNESRGHTTITGNYDSYSIESLKRRMSASKLRRLMSTIMVRNRPEDIMKDISLPPLHEKIVRLPFGYFQALTHNCQVGLIHANAVLSEREGIDYFFHPKNTKHLRQVIANLQQSCFWFSGGGDGTEALKSTTSSNGKSPLGDKEQQGGKEGENDAAVSTKSIKMSGFVYQIQEALSNVKKGYEKDLRRREAFGVGAYPPEDVDLLKQIIKHLERALQDECWVRIAQMDHMAYFCRNLPKVLQPGQSKHQQLTPSSSISSSTPMPGEGLYRDYGDWHAVLSEDDLVCSHFNTQPFQMDTESTEPQLQPQQEQGQNSHNNRLYNAADAHICMVNAAQVEQAREAIAILESARSSGASFSLGKKKEPSALLRMLLDDKVHRPLLDKQGTSIPIVGDKGHDQGNDEISISVEENDLLSQLKEALTRERLSQATIVSSASTKLNYIVSRILLVHRDEKTIVFCDHPNAIYELYHYLLMAKVRCLLYLRHMPLSQRSKNIMTFNTSEVVSVLLMDTRAGAAYGIDLSAASRIYFVSPPFHTALERQAIKRAHRIGQRRPVFVETLIIQDSFEEAVLERRREEDNFVGGGPMNHHEVNNSTGTNGNANGEGSSSAPLTQQQKKKKQEQKPEGFGRTMEKDGKMRETISRVRFIPLDDSARIIQPLSYYAFLKSEQSSSYNQTTTANNNSTAAAAANNISIERDKRIYPLDSEIPVVFPRNDRQLEALRLAEQANHQVCIGDDEDEETEHHDSSNSSTMDATVLAKGAGSSKKRRQVTFSLAEPEVMGSPNSTTSTDSSTSTSTSTSTDELEMETGRVSYKRGWNADDDQDTGGEEDGQERYSRYLKTGEEESFAVKRTRVSFNNDTLDID
ncbi:hypothetical protein BGW41_007720 [Actinomortierella wolfii]|nr:hypothetical protein BGW41_007720 [Actinomortierella wolfii]